MAQLFPKWSNKLPTYAAIGTVIFGLGLIAFVSYYFSPKYTDVGYRPDQPVDYSHKLHAGDLGIDCRYCHTAVENAPHANIPPTQTCMNCHKLVGTDNEKLLPVLESWANDIPIQWVRVHEMPDYVYFDHSIHLTAGVGCASCHGNVHQMKKVMQVEPLSMSWCLDCHRNPEDHLRPQSELTNMDWTPPENQKEAAKQIILEKNINPPIECSACHR